MMMMMRRWPSIPRLSGMRLAAASGSDLETLQLVEHNGELAHFIIAH
jgi:hypothetical protein